MKRFFSLILIWQAAIKGSAQDTTTGLIVHYPLAWTAQEKISGIHGGLMNGAYLAETAGLEFPTGNAFLWSNAVIGAVTNRITIALWVRPDTVEAFFSQLVAKGRSSPVPYFLTLRYGLLNFTYNYGAAGMGELQATNPLQANVWQHVAVTSDGASVRLFVGGQQVATQTASVNFEQEDYQRLILGDSYPGAIRDVRIYNRALSTQEIGQLNAMSPPVRVGTAYTGLWTGTVSLNEVKEARTGTWGPTPAPFQETMLLHVDGTGVGSLLQEATVMQTRVTPPTLPEHLVVTRPELIPNYDGVTLRGGRRIGQRFSSATLGFPGDTLSLAADGTAFKAEFALPAAHPLNPFRHKYHPDLASGRAVGRTISFTLPPADSPSDHKVTGTLTELISGLHKTTLEARGPVTFTRVSTSGKLNQP